MTTSNSTEYEKREKSKTINKEKILIVGGKDEENFLKALFRIPQLEPQLENIQILPIGGKNKLYEEMEALVRSENWRNVKSIGLIRDADKSAENAFKSITGVLKKRYLSIPNSPGTFSKQTSKKGKPRIGIFIMPNGKDQGALESLCLSTVAEDNPEMIKCIDSFMKCNKDLDTGYEKPKNKDKARCRAFLSLMEEDTLSLGLAAQKNYWNWKSTKLEPLIKFLEEL